MLNAVLLNGQIDKIIIAPLLGFTMLGNYSLGAQVIGMMLIFSRIVYKYILKQMILLYSISKQQRGQPPDPLTQW